MFRRGARAFPSLVTAQVFAKKSGRSFATQTNTAFGARPFGFAALGVSCAAFAGATTALCFWSGGSGDAGKKEAPFDYKALRKDLENLLSDDLTVGPLLVRLAWHEAGTWDKNKKDGAPNSASMRFAPECHYGANAGLDKARKLLEPIKAKHPNVSYADLWVLASIVAIDAMGGPNVPFRFGRKDAADGTACGPDGRLPDAAQGQDHIRSIFYRMGFNDREIVALIGAHAVGECHADRSGFVGPWTHDKLGFGNGYFSELVENDWIVNKDLPKLQFKDSKTGKLMMLPADVALLLDKEFAKHVRDFAKDQEVFHKAFASAFQKLVELGNHDLAVPK